MGQLTIVKSEPLTETPPLGAHPEAKIGATPGFRPAPDHERVDDNMLSIGGVGIPPEAVLMGPLQAGRAMLDPALSAGGKVAAGASSLLKSATPVVKYAVTHEILTSLGLSSHLATVAAIAVSGWKGGAPNAAEATTAAAEAAAPAEAVAAAPSEAAAAPIARAGKSPQMIANEEALAARRAKAAALALDTAPLPFTPKAAAEPIVAASGKMQLTASEMKQFTRLTQKGVTLPDALAAVRAMRDLAARLGGASDAEVRAVIAGRR